MNQVHQGSHQKSLAPGSDSIRIGKSAPGLSNRQNEAGGMQVTDREGELAPDDYESGSELTFPTCPFSLRVAATVGPSKPFGSSHNLDAHTQQ